MAERRFEIVARERVYDGFLKLDTLKLRHERFDGAWTPVLNRELVTQRRAAAVLPYDPRSDRVVLIEQFRPGAIGEQDHDDAGGPWLIEVVAGLREQGEEAETVARRECVEECGLELGRVEFACRFRSSPGVTSEIVDVYVGEVEAPDEGGHFGEDHEHEDIRRFTLPAEDAIAMVADARITVITAVTSLQYLAIHRDRLRQQWTLPHRG